MTETRVRKLLLVRKNLENDVGYKMPGCKEDKTIEKKKEI